MAHSLSISAPAGRSSPECWLPGRLERRHPSAGPAPRPHTRGQPPVSQRSGG
eukprot:CAMPEP_0206240214 /NCGR_PEP_ID=MMETSP0047_2-20121206/15817_1 /ASSEMBLY_ACC=CAM_ASM_000192 /TAXON_ID=195065 /ORGANISM="Chroomonas mesostigmatica_cf, Strain CCMP1168" /LENGTH=51 /DNA_ID=CAMNT_0053664977 /DNA_START=310 /DNA_END=462 /DNA_ORIENTATION=+